LELLWACALGVTAERGVSELFKITLHDFLQVLLWSTVGAMVTYLPWQYVRRSLSGPPKDED
jgi:hypothetical protein